MKKSMFLLLVFCAIFSLAGKEPKYIFLFIGDGMAITQRMVAEEFYRKTGGRGNDGKDPVF